MEKKKKKRKIENTDDENEIVLHSSNLRRDTLYTRTVCDAASWDKKKKKKTMPSRLGPVTVYHTRAYTQEFFNIYGSEHRCEPRRTYLRIILFLTASRTATYIIINPMQFTSNNNNNILSRGDG